MSRRQLTVPQGVEPKENFQSKFEENQSLTIWFYLMPMRILWRYSFSSLIQNVFGVSLLRYSSSIGNSVILVSPLMLYVNRQATITSPFIYTTALFTHPLSLSFSNTLPSSHCTFPNFPAQSLLKLYTIYCSVWTAYYFVGSQTGISAFTAAYLDCLSTLSYILSVLITFVFYLVKVFCISKLSLIFFSILIRFWSCQLFSFSTFPSSCDFLYLSSSTSLCRCVRSSPSLLYSGMTISLVAGPCARDILFLCSIFKLSSRSIASCDSLSFKVSVFFDIFSFLLISRFSPVTLSNSAASNGRSSVYSLTVWEFCSMSRYRIFFYFRSCCFQLLIQVQVFMQLLYLSNNLSSSLDWFCRQTSLLQWSTILYCYQSCFFAYQIYDQRWWLACRFSYLRFQSSWLTLVLRCVYYSLSLLFWAVRLARIRLKSSSFRLSILPFRFLTSTTFFSVASLPNPVVSSPFQQ